MQQAFGEHPGHLYGHRVKAAAGDERDITGGSASVGVVKDGRPQRRRPHSGGPAPRSAIAVVRRRGDQPVLVREDGLRQ